MSALERKDLASAAREADALDALQWRLKSDPTNDADDEDDEGKPDRVFTLLETASLDLRGNLKCAQADIEGGMALLAKAAGKEKKDIGYNEPPQYTRPRPESIGYAYLNAHHVDE